MKVRPIIFSAPMVRALLEGRKTQTRRLASSPLAKCERGDLLWVRENWAHDATDADDLRRKVEDAIPDHSYGPYYAADENFARGHHRIRPSIHLPRWASRLTLKVTGVKIEPVQAIGLQDVIAEGCEVRQFWLFGANAEERDAIGRNVYRGVWQSLHGDASWDANPEVVALTFTVHKQNVDEFLRQRKAA